MHERNQFYCGKGSLNWAGEKIGTASLINALRRCVTLSQNGKVAGIRVILDVLDEDALGFYQRFGGFGSLKSVDSSGEHLFIPIKQIVNLLESNVESLCDIQLATFK